jgi:hypothetical protein
MMKFSLEIDLGAKERFDPDHDLSTPVISVQSAALFR